MQYLALPIVKQAPTEGIETIVDPEDLTASPDGWTVVSGTDSKATAGNNVVVYKSSQSSTSKESSTDTFNYPWAPASQASVSANVDAARTNAFYIVNTIHDITYRYGFTESAFNFQVSYPGSQLSRPNLTLLSERQLRQGRRRQRPRHCLCSGQRGHGASIIASLACAQPLTVI